VELNKMWKEYQNKNNYATKVEYQDTIEAIRKIIEILETE